MRRIPLVKYTENHDGQQGEIFDKINHDAPLELRRAGDATGTQCWDPLGVTLSHTWYQQRQRVYIEEKRNSTFVRAYQNVRIRNSIMKRVWWDIRTITRPDQI
jgi:hypothetical protein